jgi:di/tricarboxylate transporter
VLVQGEIDAIAQLEKFSDFSAVEIRTEEELAEYHPSERMFVVRLPKHSGLAEETLAKSRLADVFDFRVLAVFRDGELRVMPRGDEVLLGGDLLLIEGQHSDLDVLRGLQELEIDTKVPANVTPFESERLTLMDATLDPRSALAGRTVGELNFRERYGIELAGIWREGETVGTELADERLQIGDALLLLGPRDRLQLLSSDSDFLILTPLGQEPPDTRRAPLAAAIMLGVVLTVMAGYAPISIAAVIGGTIMVLTGCLNMEQAYRAIDWRAIFLIAGMLPLGTAMQDTGAAEYLANQVMELLGDAGPWPVIMGLYILTAMATMIIPTAALVVLMSPIVLSAMGDLNVAPETAMMAVAMAASASFTSPISHPANILVMGPGGYRFVDYLKVGVPLTIVVFITVMVLLPILWPLVPV